MARVQQSLMITSLIVNMYVCLSVKGLQLKYTGLQVVYMPFWHVPLMHECNRRLSGQNLMPE